MPKGTKVILIVLFLLFTIFGIFFVISIIKPKPARLSVDGSPLGVVYIDGVQVGKTPYQGTFKAGEIDLQVSPEGTNLLPFEAKINLTPGVQTIVRRNFANTTGEESGEMISFEKSSKDDTSIAIISNPDSAQVVVDGLPKGFTPLKIVRLIQGEHQIIINQTGYREKVLSVKTVKGYRLIIDVQLAKDKNVEIKPISLTNEKKVESEKTIEILNTPTGYLRVRETPLTAAIEIGKVKPGETYKWISTDTKSGWYQIELEANKSGWISPDYATISATIKQ